MATTVRAGALRRKVTIQEETSSSSDSYGHPVNTWTNLATVPTVWAEIEPIQGRELIEGQALLGTDPRRVRIRFRTDLTREMRVLIDDNPYTIESIIDVEDRRKKLELTVKYMEAS